MPALQRINKGLPLDAINEAIYKLKNFASGSLLQKNMTFTDYLQNGVPVKFVVKGEERAGLVRQIMPTESGFMLLVENDVMEAKTVLLAMGAARPVLLPGEEEQLGRGVSYCATCDGMFYRGRRIAVLSGSAQGVEESAFLAGLAAELDYYRLKAHDMTGLDARIHPSEEKPRAIARDGEALVLQTDKGEHRYDGIFIFRAAMPLSMLLADLRTEGSYIPVDRGMRTNIPGVFAAGDCTGKPLQVPKAVGEGNIAAISAAEYIAKRG